MEERRINALYSISEWDHNNWLEFSYQKRNMESQKAKILALKNKCVHLEEVVAYIKDSTLG